MKLRKKFYFNDGTDGIVIAKNLKQAVKILCKRDCKGMETEILTDCKKAVKSDKYWWKSNWSYDYSKIKAKRNKIVGYCC